ncbi:MAG: sialate O-acetylesterase [Hyphomicrobiaceae bacterium]|nr:sialate O-acetylesterase [Hyphomicrobiaceae bacterium]
MTKLVLACGQSNMRGGAGSTGGPAFSGMRNVTVWNNTNEGGANGTAFVSPPAATSPPWDVSGGNNLAAWFCHRLAFETGEPVKLILVCKGGLPISAWSPTTPGEQWSEIAAVCTAAAAGPADIFLWHQGEDDILAGTAEATYKAAFLALIAALVSAGYLKSDAQQIVGGLRYPGSDAFLQNLASENALIEYASDTPYADYDGTHFTGPGLYQFGYEGYWNAYSRLTGPKIIAGRLAMSPSPVLR